MDLARRCWCGRRPFSGCIAAASGGDDDVAGCKEGELSTAVADGFGMPLEKKKGKQNHTGTERDVVPPLPFRYLIPSTPAPRDMGEALLLLYREEYRPSVSMLYRGCGAARYLKAITIPSPSRLGMLSHFVGTETR